MRRIHRWPRGLPSLEGKVREPIQTKQYSSIDTDSPWHPGFSACATISCWCPLVTAQPFFSFSGSWAGLYGPNNLGFATLWIPRRFDQWEKMTDYQTMGGDGSALGSLFCFSTVLRPHPCTTTAPLDDMSSTTQLSQGTHQAISSPSLFRPGDGNGE